MLETVLVVLPVFALILLGHLCRRRAFPGDGFWEPAEALTYYLLLPCLLAKTLAEADFSRLAAWPMLISIMAALLAVTLMTLLLRPLMQLEGPAFTSLHQSAIRMNTYIGLSLAFGLFGPAGLTSAAVAVAAAVPLGNVMAVAMLARFGAAAGPDLSGALRRLVANPLILACLLGLVLNLAGIGLPPVIDEMMTILARAALPLGLLAVGAALDPAAIRGIKQLALVSCALKLIAFPLVAYLIARGLGVEGVNLTVAVIYGALPTASSSYILARQMGGDAPLMAGLCTLQTLLSMASLPLVLALLAAA